LVQLKHKVFWLDTWSLRDILEESIRNGEKGLINLKQEAYEELCMKVFAPIEDGEFNGIHNRRVFRRLRGQNGNVKIDCILPNGEPCKCEGESLSFRGLHSKECPRNVGNKLKAKATPIVEVGQPKPKEFTVTASVAKLHPDEAAKQSKGRGIFFEDADEATVKGLYEYISSHPE